MASTKTYVGRANRILSLREKYPKLNPTEEEEYRDLQIIMAAAGINTGWSARRLIRYAQIVDHRALVTRYCKLSSQRSDRRSDRKALKKAANELRGVEINPDESLIRALREINRNAHNYASDQKKHSKRQTASPARRAAGVRGKTVKRMPKRIPNPYRRRLSFA